MAGESLIFESNKFILFIALLIFYSCTDSNQKEDKDALEPSFKKEDTLLSVKNLKDTVRYQDLLLPDSTINNKLRLENYLSAESFCQSKIELIDLLRESPVAIFCNEDKSEYLMAYQYEGNAKNAFSCFEIGYTDDKILRNKYCATKEKFFSTESGIKLGIPLESLTASKGSSYKILEQDDTIITYRINDASSDFLRKYNMPGYFLECSLKNDKIIRIKFGFDYP